MNYARFMAHFNDSKCGFISEDVKLEWYIAAFQVMVTYNLIMFK